jgi:ADP-heptose:LPS heptosyltransferase
MASNRSTLLKKLYRCLDAGRNFKRYAPQSPPAPAGPHHKLAIVDLITNLGDKVMVFPLLDALRRENPDLEINFFTQGAGRLVKIHPAIDHLYVMEAPQKRGLFTNVPTLVRIMLWWWTHWRHLRFHTVVVLRGGVEPHRSHHLAWLIGGKNRIAYSPELEPERPEFQYDVAPLFTSLITTIRAVHEVNRGAEVLQLAGLLKGPVQIGDTVDSIVTIAHSVSNQDYRKSLDLDQKPYAIVALGASVPRRAWPVESFAKLAIQELVSRHLTVVLIGAAETAHLAVEFKAYVGKGVLDLTGRTDFEQLVGLCGGASCFLGNDSGPAHIAGACGVPTLVITAFAETGLKSHHASPNRSHPVGPRVAVVQPEKQMEPCTTECITPEAHCIKQISVEKCAATLTRLLEGDGSRHALSREEDPPARVDKCSLQKLI